MKHVDPKTLAQSGKRLSPSICGTVLTAEGADDPKAGAGQCDRMCSECSRTCTRDWGHSGPHRCDNHWRG